MQSAFGDYATGLAGGAVYAIVQSFVGSGLLSSLIAPLITGSVLKGTRGTVIATIAGFQGAADLLGNLGGLIGGGSAPDLEM